MLSGLNSVAKGTFWLPAQRWENRGMHWGPGGQHFPKGGVWWGRSRGIAQPCLGNQPHKPPGESTPQIPGEIRPTNPRGLNPTNSRKGWNHQTLPSTAVPLRNHKRTEKAPNTHMSPRAGWAQLLPAPVKNQLFLQQLLVALPPFPTPSRG